MAFKDLFIKSEEEVQNVNNVQQPQVNNVQPNRSVGWVGTVSIDKSTDGVSESTPQVSQRPASITADEKIINKIWEKIIAANRPGPDYLELKNNVDALDDLPISNEQKLVSAFKVLKKGYPNFQKDDITKAIDFYINIVNDEKNNGLKELDALIATNVSGVENEIKEMQARSEELKRQYDELQSKIGEKTIELQKSKNDLDMKHNTFIGSVDAVINVLTNDKDNINAINF